MQRTEILTLVTGAFVGLWGGMLGAFLVCSRRWTVLYHFLSHADSKKYTLLLPEERR